VHVVRLYPPGGSDVDLPRRALIEAGATVVAPGSAGSAIIAGVAGPSESEPVAVHTDLVRSGRPQVLGENEIVLFKPRWGAFYRTDLQTWLGERDADTVVVAGCNLPNCPRATLFEASERDYRAVLTKDAVSQSSTERMQDLAGMGVSMVSTVEVLEQLALPVSPSGG
jgi:nicotinamidase-related amidase